MKLVSVVIKAMTFTTNVMTLAQTGICVNVQERLSEVVRFLWGFLKVLALQTQNKSF